MSNLTFGGFDLQDAIYLTSNYGFDNMAPTSESNLAIINRDGVKNISVIIDPRQINFAGTITGTTASDLETNIDNFKVAMGRERQNLDIGMADTTTRRFREVNAVDVQVGSNSQGTGRSNHEIQHAPYRVTFSATDPTMYATSETSLKSDTGISVFIKHDSFTAVGTKPPVPRILLDINSETDLISLGYRTGYYENFADGTTNESEWGDESGTWAVSGSKYTQTNTANTEHSNIYGTQLYDDFTLEGTAEADDDGKIGLIFGSTDATSGSEDYYAFIGDTANNVLKLQKYVGGTASSLATDYSVTLAVATQYKLKVDYNSISGLLECFYFTTKWVKVFSVYADGIKGGFGLFSMDCASKHTDIKCYPYQEERYIIVNQTYSDGDTVLLDYWSENGGQLFYNMLEAQGTGNFPKMYTDHLINGAYSKTNFYTLVASSTASNYDLNINHFARYA